MMTPWQTQTLMVDGVHHVALSVSPPYGLCSINSRDGDLFRSLQILLTDRDGNHVAFPGYTGYFALCETADTLSRPAVREYTVRPGDTSFDPVTCLACMVLLGTYAE